MRRIYFCPLVGSGTPADPFTPAAIPDGVSWTMTDSRTDQTTGVGKVLITADVTDAQHAVIKATTGVVYLPFEDASGASLADTDVATSIPSTLRTQLRNRLEGAGIPVDDVQDGDTIKSWRKRILVRLLLRQVLGNDDFPLGLDTLVSSLTATQRNRIQNKLSVVGIDTTGAGIVGSDTIRQAIRKAIAVNGSPLFGGM